MLQLHNAFTLKHEGRVPCLITTVRISLPASSAEEAAKNNSQSKEYKGLWDSGASNSVITKKIADEMGLKSIGMVDVNHANGTSTRDKYLVGVILPNNLVIGSVTVVEGVLSGFDVLIGMDIITLGDFAVTNKDNNTIMSFRIPSFKTIDFVPESNQHNFVMTSGTKKQKEQYLQQHK